MVRISEPVSADIDNNDLHSDQPTDSEELISGDVHSCVDVDQSETDSRKLSDATEQSLMAQQLNVDVTSDAQVSLSCSTHPSSSIFSHPDESKLDHSVISSTLKNVSQNEDQGLVYIVSSKSSSEYLKCE